MSTFPIDPTRGWPDGVGWVLTQPTIATAAGERVSSPLAHSGAEGRR